MLQNFEDYQEKKTARKTKIRRKPRHEHQRLLLVSTSNPCTYCLQKWALVTQEKMASPLDYNPSYPYYWSADSRDALFSAHFNSLLFQFTGFSVCHPVCYDHTMHLSLRHAIYSATLSAEATATFMFIPYWKGSIITNPYSNLLTTYPYLCHKLGTIPANEVNYATPQSCTTKRLLYPGFLESPYHSSLEHSCTAPPE